MEGITLALVELAIQVDTLCFRLLLEVKINSELSVPFPFFSILPLSGPPDKTTVKVNMKQNGNNLDFSMTVSDSSPAPPRTIIFLNPVVSARVLY